MLDMILEVDYSLLFEFTDRPGPTDTIISIEYQSVVPTGHPPDSWHAGSDPRWGLKNS